MTDKQTTLARIRVASPADVLAAVPRLIGFHPTDSLVVIGAKGERHRVELGFRYDLPTDTDSRVEIAEHALGVLAARHADTMILVGYGPGDLVTPLVDTIIERTDSAFRIREALRVEDGRFWSYLCENPQCCPPEGTPFDLETSGVSAAFVTAGMSALPDRAAVEALFAPPTGEALAAAEAEAHEALDTWLAAADRIQRGKVAVLDAIRVYREGDEYGEAKVATLTWLAVSLDSLQVRDDAWARMVPEHRDAHLRLWRDVVTTVDPALVTPAASLLAFVAWQSGDGTLANIALDRALAITPDYSMAQLLRDVLSAGVPPSQARLPMTPEEVAESYASPETNTTNKEGK